MKGERGIKWGKWWKREKGHGRGRERGRERDLGGEVGEGEGHVVGALGELLELEDAHGPVPDHGLAV